MKKFLSLLIVSVFAVLAFGGCATQKTTVNVKIVVDNEDDGKYEKVIIDQPVEVTGKNPNVDSILNTLKDQGVISIEFKTTDTGATEVAKIEDYEVKDEDTDTASYIYRWYVRVNKDDVNGLWADKTISEGDEVIFRYETTKVNVEG